MLPDNLSNITLEIIVCGSLIILQKSRWSLICMLYCVSGTGSPMVVNNRGDQGETAYTKLLVAMHGM